MVNFINYEHPQGNKIYLLSGGDFVPRFEYFFLTGDGVCWVWLRRRRRCHDVGCLLAWQSGFKTELLCDAYFPNKRITNISCPFGNKNECVCVKVDEMSEW